MTADLDPFANPHIYYLKKNYDTETNFNILIQSKIPFLFKEKNIYPINFSLLI